MGWGGGHECSHAERVIVSDFMGVDEEGNLVLVTCCEYPDCPGPSPSQMEAFLQVCLSPLRGRACHGHFVGVADDALHCSVSLRWRRRGNVKRRWRENAGKRRSKRLQDRQRLLKVCLACHGGMWHWCMGGGSEQGAEVSLLGGWRGVGALCRSCD